MSSIGVSVSPVAGRGAMDGNSRISVLNRHAFNARRKNQGSSEVVENEAARHATIFVAIRFDSSCRAHRLPRSWLAHVSDHAYANPHAHAHANTESELGAAHNIPGRGKPQFRSLL